MYLRVFLGSLALLMSFHARADGERDLSRYLLFLKKPEQAWGKRKSKLPEPDPVLSGSDAEVRTELAQMLAQYAPQIWWHSKDPYPPMDPLEFLEKSSLYYRGPSGIEKQIVERGEINALKLREMSGADPKSRPYQNGFAFNGAGYFLRYEDQKNGARALATLRSSEKVPFLWRLGEGSFARLLEQENPSPISKRVLIEYWYHVPYNLATRVGIGNHQGDWEGVSMLVELSVSAGHLKHKLLASYFAEHDSGTWLCSKELERTADGAHIEAYSAMGTHATYATSGKHRSAVLTDETEKGEAWNTWERLRPLALEPYYGFSGAWGEARYFSFMTGPLVPGPGYKALPRDASPKDETLRLAALIGRCVKE